MQRLTKRESGSVSRSDQGGDAAAGGRDAVAIVGAGPYGLALAAHLAASGVPFRIFGAPMRMWRERMPRSMHLKSEPFATDLYDPGRTFPLSRFCRERGIPYRDVGLPVSLETFCAYGAEFQRRFVPDLDTREVTWITRKGDGYEIEIEGVERMRFGRVVLAVGISHYGHIPPEFTHLPDTLLSHSSTNGDLGRFRGKRVAVIGGGSSAIDCAVMLASVGADTHLVTRRQWLAFHAPPGTRTLVQKLRWPMSAVGPGWKGVLCTRLPDVFRLLPSGFRAEVTRRFLGPAPCWFTREPFERDVTLHKSVRGLSLAAEGEAVTISFENEGASTALKVDHVIAATGFRAELGRLPFLDPALAGAVALEEGTPVLDRNFESSVPGLFFTGLSASNAFGPMLRFACGAGFAARRLTARLRRRQAHPVVAAVPVRFGTRMADETA